jgi:hypothetical protein
MKLYNYDKDDKLTSFYDTEFLEKLDLKAEQMENLVFKRGKRVKLSFTRSVFVAFMKLVVDDCIKNDVKFVAPGKAWFYIYISKTPDANVERIIRTNIYKDVDMFASGFSVYEFTFYSVYLPQGNRYRSIRIGYKKYKDVIAKANTGFRYAKKKVIRTYHSYIDDLAKVYPGLTIDQLRMIIRHGCWQIHKQVALDKKDLRMKNTFYKFSMTIFKYKSARKVIKGFKQKENAAK